MACTMFIRVALRHMTGSRSRALPPRQYSGRGMGANGYRIDTFCGRSVVRVAACFNFSAAWLTLSRSTPIVCMKLRASFPVITCLMEKWSRSSISPFKLPRSALPRCSLVADIDSPISGTLAAVSSWKHNKRQSGKVAGESPKLRKKMERDVAGADQFDHLVTEFRCVKAPEQKSLS